jgi:hypothetical protein
VAGACGPSDSIGELPVIGCVSVQAVLAFAAVATEIAFFALLAYYVAG